MVLAAKIFRLREPLSLRTIAAKLRDYKREEIVEIAGKRLLLTTEVRGLAMRMGMLQAVLVADRPLLLYQRGSSVPTTVTREVPFYFAEHEGRALLLVLEKKHLANRIANELSEILFIKGGQIVEARVPEDSIKRFHEENPDGTKLIWFDQVDVPAIDKLSLCGPSLADTALYTEYCDHGKIWYAVITSRKYGYVVGVARNGIVVLFSRASEEDFVSYIASEIFPLVQ